MASTISLQARKSLLFLPLSRSSHLTFASKFSTSYRHDASYGFIGLGQMGFPMAQNLRARIAPTDTLIVHDINTTATAQLQKETDNVSIAQQISEVTEKADTIITVLPEPKHVRAVYKELLSNPPDSKSDKLFIDCSTIDPTTSGEVAALVSASGQGSFVDAPMSGGVVGARAAQLTFMLGSPPNLLSRVETVLHKIGKRVVHLGPQTSGLKGKLANNYLLALNNIATAEAMNMGVQWGLDPYKLADMINTATGKCWPSEVNNPVEGISPNAPAGRDYQGGFGTALMLKDLRLALKAGEEAGIEPLLGDHAESIYDAVTRDETCKNRDFSVVYRFLRNKNQKS